MANKDAAYQKFSDLAMRFEEQFDSYKKSEYNETLTRRDAALCLGQSAICSSPTTATEVFSIAMPLM